MMRVEETDNTTAIMTAEEEALLGELQATLARHAGPAYDLPPPPQHEAMVKGSSSPTETRHAFAREGLMSPTPLERIAGA